MFYNSFYNSISPFYIIVLLFVFSFQSWVVIFPEGTLFDPVDIPTIEKSRKIAEEKKLPVLGNHLTPRYRGAYMIFDRLKEKLDAVYNVTYVYDNSMTDEGRKTAPQLIGE